MTTTTIASLKNLGLSETELASISPEAMEAKVAQVQQFILRWLPGLITLAVLALFFVAPNVMAQTNDYQGMQEATKKIGGFLNGVKKILGPMSIVVVTIAFIFAGYQIAFNHKRISDVAPVLIGAIIIGASAQLAGMFIDSKEIQQDTIFQQN
ncbi:MAG: TrbC/VirB2 family protein [Pseudomonadota bacterium]|nr:TrbC/VirB2 family protein [Pseudomonadota bacterium]